jgi:phospholipase C
MAHGSIAPATRVRLRTFLSLVGVMSVLAGASVLAPASAAPSPALGQVQHIVVIYAENHSFDNLWGKWPGVDGLDTPAAQAKAAQVTQVGTPLTCLPQNDVNLTVPPQSAACSVTLNNGTVQQSHFPTAPFKIDDYIPASARTCYDPAPAAPFAPATGVANGNGSPGGCTRDLVHRYYQEQFQIDGGSMDRYVQGSDAVGLSMGYYDTTQLPMYKFLTGPDAPRHTIDDHFFQSAFGGSFLNHQWLVAAQTPTYASADASGTTTGCATGSASCDLHSVVDANGMPNTYPLYTPTAVGTSAPAVIDGPLTEAAGANGGCAPSFPNATPAPAGTSCGDFAINTIQPTYQPYSPGTALGRRLPPLRSSNIGDALSAKGVSWAWYSGGWDNAAGNTGGPGWTNGSGPACSDVRALATAVYPNCPDELFQFHHQAFNYFANYAPGTAGRAHLKDEQAFLADTRAGTLPAVSFIKPLGAENSHPGYASEAAGDQHLVDLVKAVVADRADWASTAVVITYDEFGGSWDHVAPPTGAGVADKWGPGTRVPAIVISPLATGGVDHTSHDTTSILATIEHRFGLAAMSSRDAAVADLTTSLAADAPASTPAPGAPATPSARPSKELPWEVSVGKYGTVAAAERRRKALTAKGFSGYGVETETKTRFDVARDYATRSLAASAVARLAKSGFTGVIERS